MYEVVRESEHAVTIKSGKISRKSDYAIKIDKPDLPRKPVSPRKKGQLLMFYATKGSRTTSSRTAFKSSRTKQVAQDTERRILKS